MIAAEITTLDMPDRSTDAENGMEEVCRQLPVLNTSGYEHKKEQFYLMLLEGRSKEFIDFFLKQDSGLSTVTLDFLRASAAFCGEEFVQKHLLLRKFSSKEAFDMMRDFLVGERYEQLPDISGKLEQLSRITALMETVEAALKQTTKESRLKDRKIESMALENMKAQHQTEIAGYEQKISELEAQLKTEAQKAGVEKRKLQMMYDTRIQGMKHTVCSAEEGYWARRRRKRHMAAELQRQHELETFLLNTLSDTRYSREQLDLIMEAVEDNFTLEQLKSICNPEMKIENMRIVRQYIERKQGEGDRRGTEY